MCAGSCRRGAHWKSPRPETTTFFCSVPRAAGKRCLLRDCPACCRKPAKPKRWKRLLLLQSAGVDWILAVGASGLTGHLITPPVQWHWWVVVDRFRSECDRPEVPANARPPSGSRLTAASGRSGTRPGPRTDPGTLPARPKAQRHPVASRLARDARGLATMPYKPERSRAHLATDQDSCVAFSNAESGPYWMQIRVVGEADPLRQALSANVINGLSLLGNGPVSAIDSTLWREQGPLKPPLGDPSGQL